MVAPPPRTPRPGGAGRPPWLAIAALVMALIPCCPMASLLGAFLGLLALRRQRVAGVDTARAGGRTGVRLAWAAVVIGVAAAILWTVVLERWRVAQDAAFDTAMVDAVEGLVVAAQEERVDEALAAWARTDPPPPEPEAIRVFGQAAASRYGRLDRAAIVSSARSGSMLAPVVDVALVLHFERQTRSASARFAMQVIPGQWTPAFVLRAVRIEDPERGDLTLEAGAAADP